MRIQRLLEKLSPKREALELQAALIDMGWDDIELDNGDLSVYGDKTVVLTATREISDLELPSIVILSNVDREATKIKVVGYIDNDDDDGFYWESHDSQPGEFDGLSTAEMIKELERIYGRTG